MIKKIIVLILLLAAPSAFADEGYVSPETYAVNEADLLDYTDIAPPARPNIDKLDKPVKIKHHKIKSDTKTYKKGVMYHIAKWWTDARYKREEPHHGTKHEIKVKQRMEYEKQMLEKQDQTDEEKL